MEDLIKENIPYSSRYVTSPVNPTSYSRYLSSGSKTRFLNGTTRTSPHVCISPHKRNFLSTKKKSEDVSTAVDQHSDSTKQINKSHTNSKSAGQINPYINSSILKNNNQMTNKNDDCSNTEDPRNTSEEKKKRRRRGLTICGCLCILLCLCTALILALAIAIALALVATSIQSNTTTNTSETTTDTNTSSTTQSTTVASTATISTSSTIISSTIIANASASTNSYSGSEKIIIDCSGALTNITIQIFVQKTVGATYGAMYTTFFGGVLSQSYTTTGTQIIYTWTIINGQMISCVSGPYNVVAQFGLIGTPQIASNDTYIVTATTSGGMTMARTGHF